MSHINSITLEVISNGLLSIAEQMGVILTKTAYSTNIKERKDLSVAIFDADGKVLSLAQHIPIHFSSLFGAVEELLKRWDKSEIYDGDVYIANDPYTGGGSHLPDIALVKPVFYEGKLIAFVVNNGHHADRSRRGPTIFDEGLRIPVVKLYEKGKLNKDIYDLILLNFQLKEERRGDIQAQLITNQFGADKIVELCEKIGLETYFEFCREWLKYGEKKARTAIQNLPDGEYEFEDILDDDGNGNENLQIRVKLVVSGDHLLFDFSGSHPQVTGPYNCVKSALLATVFYSVKCLLDKTIPANSGFFDSIDVKAEPGTIVCASEPAPTFDRETTTQRLADVIFGAFAKIDPENVIAAGCGAVTFFSIAGQDARSGKPYVYVETIGGGNGARYNKDGLDAVQVHMTNSSNLPIESLEMEYPLLVKEYALEEDSGGPGMYRGGMGIRRGICILDDSENTVLAAASTERSRTKPWGLQGGMGGSTSYLDVCHEGRKINTQNKVRNVPLESGDTVTLVSAGGGGYGDPAKRDINKVKKDYEEGKISLETKNTCYPAANKEDER
ncbi:hydantoinase B/oxoprolinase family protein [Lacrimispora sp. NSJ-141]|uniref:Hydantoinase B/oxoprolinase family protein n=1 Tax=Lientehia hominis TaxID=2897778 RepID=A0AAP2WA60_9FIRM|nr:hydantoinase B/oxoprolinase family protein [Lientehia hominis]MCD2492837.1 hydantoinase B/oxoprolinase family protein [Lientehia hominis]